MKNLRITAKRINGDETLKGTGINMFDNTAILYNRFASYEVNPDTLTIRCNNEMEKYVNPQTDEKLTYELHNKLMKTLIDFMVEHDLKDIDEIYFGADSLQISKSYHKWTPATDSSLSLVGYQDGKRKEINTSI